jgi:hypothetical protein
MVAHHPDCVLVCKFETSRGPATNFAQKHVLGLALDGSAHGGEFVARNCLKVITAARGTCPAADSE